MSLVKIDWHPDSKTLRRFGVRVVVFAFLLGAYSFWKGWNVLKITAYLLAGAGALTSALPNMGKPLYKGWMGVAFVIATVVSNAVIALIFYGLITPMALVFKVLGRDCLRLKRGEGSHWVPVTMPADAERYERTF